jgi:hypothetical protein
MVEMLIKKSLEEQIKGSGPIWVEDELLEAGKNAGVVFENRDLKELMAELEDHGPKSKLERLIEIVSKEALDIFEDVPEEKLKKFGNRLRNNGSITILIK